MPEFFGGRTVEIISSSGILRVTIRPRPSLLHTVTLLGVDSYVGSFLYAHWSAFSTFTRVFSIWIMVSGICALFYRAFGEEIIEFDAKKLTIHKGIHGWERKREYEIADCRELEWEPGNKGTPPRLKCKSGWRSFAFAHYVPEQDAYKILVALQETLPDAAQKICSFDGGKEHFLSLGLNK